VASIVRIVKHILPEMRTRGWGRIIQMSSVGAMMPSEMTLNYGGTKAAVAVFSTGLAKVLAGTGITVNTVTPGPVLTPMLDSWIRDIAKAYGTASGRMGAPVRHRRAAESAGPGGRRNGGPHCVPCQSAGGFINGLTSAWTAAPCPPCDERSRRGTSRAVEADRSLTGRYRQSTPKVRRVF
jgi:NAD(P)-dependent dehydrogenase (short-subunit alcohol dehydrogenase family)